MNNYRYRKCGQRYSEIGRIAGYVILRFKGAVPFLVSEKELSIDYFDTMPNEPPIILERRKTVRAKRPVQQRKAKMPRNCGTCFYNNVSSSIRTGCGRPDNVPCIRASYWKRGTSTVA